MTQETEATRLHDALVRHRGWEMIIGWSGTAERWEAHGNIDEGESESGRADGSGATIPAALDACADEMDRLYEDAADQAPHICAGCIGGGLCELEVDRGFVGSVSEMGGYDQDEEPEPDIVRLDYSEMPPGYDADRHPHGSVISAGAIVPGTAHVSTAEMPEVLGG